MSPDETGRTWQAHPAWMRWAWLGLGLSAAVLALVIVVIGDEPGVTIRDVFWTGHALLMALLGWVGFRRLGRRVTAVEGGLTLAPPVRHLPWDDIVGLRRSGRDWSILTAILRDGTEVELPVRGDRIDEIRAVAPPRVRDAEVVFGSTGRRGVVP